MSKAKSVLLVADSGTGKTNQLFRMVKWIMDKPENKGKRWRHICTDGGGWAPFEDSGYIDRGIVEAFDMSNRQLALADIIRLYEGYWPINTNQGDKEIFKSTPECETQDFENIVGYSIEGITSLGTNWISHISTKGGGVGFKYSSSYSEDGYSRGMLQMGHYGNVQVEINDAIRKFGCLPVQWVLWSALVSKSDDEHKDSVLAPSCGAGSSINYKIPSWLGTTLYLEKALKELPTLDKDGTHKVLVYVKAWFDEHMDDTTQLKALAKCRILEELYPKLKEIYPKGYIPCVAGKQGIEKYFETVDKLNEEYRKENG